MTLVFPLPNPTRLVDRSKAGKRIVFSFVVGSFLFPSGRRLLFEAESKMTGIHSWSVKMSGSFIFTYMSALITRCLAVEYKVRPVLTYLRNPILATRWLSNLLKITQVRRDWSVDMML